MCSETFLRLPEEKRQRFLDAAWEEFTRVSFSEASINQIVRRCGIARGSFYQYFRDKEELMEYLMHEGWSYLMSGYHSILKEMGGDIFTLQLACFDRFLSQREDADPVLARFLQFLRINPGLDVPKILGDRTGLSSIWVLFAIILCGGLWGVVGMVICVPMFAVIYDTGKKLVRRGLKKKEQVEIWEKYKADFPDEV